MRPARPAKGAPPDIKKPLKNGDMHMLGLDGLKKLGGRTRKLKVGCAGGAEEGGTAEESKNLKRKREDGEGGVNKRPLLAAKKAGGPHR